MSNQIVDGVDGIQPLTREEIERRIREIEALDLESMDVDELKDRLRFLFVGYALRAPHVGVGQDLYRGVKWAEKPTSTSQLTYPPADCVMGFQRANRPGQSIFYCSTSPGVPIHELCKVDGELIAISKWKVRKKFLVNHIGYSEEVLARYGRQRSGLGWCEEVHDDQRTDVNRFIGDFLADQFAREIPPNENYRYKWPLALAELHFEDQRFGALLYPTLARNCSADNLAIKPATVDSCLELADVTYYQIKEQDGSGRFNLQRLDWTNEFGEDGTILWKGRGPQWRMKNAGDLLQFEVVNGEWVARNTAGEIVEPD